MTYVCSSRRRWLNLTRRFACRRVWDFGGWATLGRTDTCCSTRSRPRGVSCSRCCSADADGVWAEGSCLSWGYCSYCDDRSNRRPLWWCVVDRSCRRNWRRWWRWAIVASSTIGCRLCCEDVTRATSFGACCSCSRYCCCSNLRPSRRWTRHHRRHSHLRPGWFCCWPCPSSSARSLWSSWPRMPLLPLFELSSR